MALATLGALVALGAIALPSAEHRLALTLLERHAEGVLAFDTLERHSGEQWTLAQARIALGEHTLHCDAIALTLDRHAVLRGARHAEHVQASGCRVSSSTGHTPPNPTREDPTTLEQRVNRIADAALERTRSLAADSLTLNPDSLTRTTTPTTLTDISLRSDDDGWRAETTLQHDGLGATLHLQRTLTTGIRIRIADASSITAGPMTVTWIEGDIRLERDALRIQDARIELDALGTHASLAIGLVHAEPRARPPRLLIREATLQGAALTHPLAERGRAALDPAPESGNTPAESDESTEGATDETEDGDAPDAPIRRSREERIAQRAATARAARAAALDRTRDALTLIRTLHRQAARLDQLDSPLDLTIEALRFGEDLPLVVDRFHVAPNQRPEIQGRFGDALIEITPRANNAWALEVENASLVGLHHSLAAGRIDLTLVLPGDSEEHAHTAAPTQPPEGRGDPRRPRTAQANAGTLPPENGPQPPSGGPPATDAPPVRAVLRVALHDLVVVPALAAEPVGPLQLELTADATAHPSNALAMTTQVTLGGVALDAHAQLDGLATGDPLTVEFGFTERTPCQTAWRAIPAGMAPTIGPRGVRWTGTLRPRMAVTYRIGETTSLRLRTHNEPATCEAEWITASLDPRQLNDPDFVHHVREGTELPNVRVGPGTSTFVPIDTLPSYIPALMYLSEEMAFFRNRWISIPLLNRALRMNLERGYYVYGGSTVSQQLVKNLFLTREKTLARKLEEAVLVWIMEASVPKHRILELYLNCIEFGPDIFGIQEAARFYFQTDPHDLSPLEAAFLAALKPSPRIGGAWRRRGESPARGWFPQRLEALLERAATNGGHIPHSEIAHYAPFIVRFPPEGATHTNVRRQRPPGATLFAFNPDDPEHREGPPRTFRLPRLDDVPAIQP